MLLPKERIYLGKTCEFDDICLLYPPTVGDIVRIGYEKFCSLNKMLTTNDEEIQDIYTSLQLQGDFPTPFEYILLMYQIKEVRPIIEEAFKFFTHEKIVVLLDRSEILIGDIKEKHLLNSENFLDFQNSIRQLVGDKEEVPLDENLDPRLLRMKAKQRERDRVKAKQLKEKSGYSFPTLMLSTCCLNVGVTVFNIENLSYAAMIKLQEMAAKKDKYETDIASILAGADSKKINLEYWVKD